MTLKVVKTIDHVDDLQKSLRKLEKSQVLAGVPAEKAGRDSSESGNEINNAALGYIHNYGAPTANIPARPFMEPGIKDNADQITPYLGKAAEAAISGDAAGVHKNLMSAGIKAASGIKRKIDVGPFVPLKPGTLAARRRRGRTGIKPLLDTGKLRNAISFVIREK
jgi:phage gpG-like protein